MKIAVMFSPSAGKYGEYNAVGRSVEKAFSGCTLLTCAGSLGADHLPNATVVTDGIEERDYKKKIRQAVKALALQKPDMFFTVGGDGLASYVADALLMAGATFPLVGVACGTANVGPIVSILPERLEGMKLESLQYRKIAAVEVLGGGRHLSYAFNDAVFCNTVLSTVDHRTVHVDICELVKKNRKIVKVPGTLIAGDRFRVTKNGCLIRNALKRPAQIVVSPIETEKLYGKAVTGALCFSAFGKFRAAAVLLDRIAVSGPSEEFDGMRPFLTEQLLFGQGDLVSFSGFERDAEIAVDGNPFIREDDEISFRFLPDVLQVGFVP